MNSPSLPTELHSAIIEEFVSIYKGTSLRRTEETDFFPRWYLTPLLRVCKLWHILSERHVYRCISIGRAFNYRTREHVREGNEIAEELLATLTANPRLAALVEDLRLGVEFHHDLGSEWTRTNIGILHICPNVKHVSIRGIDHSDVSGLCDVLKEKSLVSFRIDHHDYDLFQFSARGGCSSKFLEVMPRWPNLRTIVISGFHEDEDEQNRPVAIDAPSCCSDLREITIDGTGLRYSDFHSFRAICNGVTTLSITIFDQWISEEMIEALCTCIRAWSSTLRYVVLGFHGNSSQTEPLWAAFSTLKGLEELRMDGFYVVSDLSSIADLAQLERLCFSPDWSESDIPIFELPICNLAEHLEDQQRFPALKHIVVNTQFRIKFGKRMEDICATRGIQLEQMEVGYRDVGL